MNKKLNLPQKKSESDPLICLCNCVRQSQIEKTIVDGIKSIDEIFDKTTAGVGACGGSCRPYLQQLIEEHAATGSFTKIIRPKARR